jgi:hypothetical protein
MEDFEVDLKGWSWISSQECKRRSRNNVGYGLPEESELNRVWRRF